MQQSNPQTMSQLLAGHYHAHSANEAVINSTSATPHAPSRLVLTAGERGIPVPQTGHDSLPEKLYWASRLALHGGINELSDGEIQNIVASYQSRGAPLAAWLGACAYMSQAITARTWHAAECIAKAIVEKMQGELSGPAECEIYEDRLKRIAIMVGFPDSFWQAWYVDPAIAPVTVKAERIGASGGTSGNAGRSNEEYWHDRFKESERLREELLTERNTLRQTLQASSSDVETTLRKELGEAKAHVASLNGDVLRLNKALDEVNAQLKADRRKFVATESDLNQALRADVDRLSKEVETLTTQRNFERERVASVMRERDHINEVKNSLFLERDKLKKDLHDVEVKWGNDATRLREVEEHLAAYQVEAIRERDALKADLDEKRTALNDLTHAHRNVQVEGQKKLSETRAELAASQEREKALEAKLKEAQAPFRLQRALENGAAVVAVPAPAQPGFPTATEAMESMAESIRSWKAKYEETQEARSKLLSEREADAATIARLERQLESERSGNNAYATELSLTKTKLVEVEAKNEVYARQLASGVTSQIIHGRHAFRQEPVKPPSFEVALALYYAHLPQVVFGTDFVLPRQAEDVAKQWLERGAPVKAYVDLVNLLTQSARTWPVSEAMALKWAGRTAKNEIEAKALAAQALAIGIIDPTMHELETTQAEAVRATLQRTIDTQQQHLTACAEQIRSSTGAVERACKTVDELEKKLVEMKAAKGKAEGALNAFLLAAQAQLAGKAKTVQPMPPTPTPVGQQVTQPAPEPVPGTVSPVTIDRGDGNKEFAYLVEPAKDELPDADRKDRDEPEGREYDPAARRDDKPDASPTAHRILKGSKVELKNIDGDVLKFNVQLDPDLAKKVAEGSSKASFFENPPAEPERIVSEVEGDTYGDVLDLLDAVAEEEGDTMKARVASMRTILEKLGIVETDTAMPAYNGHHERVKQQLIAIAVPALHLYLGETSMALANFFATFELSEVMSAVVTTAIIQGQREQVFPPDMLNRYLDLLNRD